MWTMADFSTSRFVTTRKPHQCWGCGEMFPAGSRMEHTAGVWGGDFYSSYYCDTCHDWLVENQDYFLDNGIGLGDVKTAMEEEARG